MINFTKRICFTVFNICALALIWAIYVPFDDKIPVYVPIILTCVFGLSFIGGWVFLCHRDKTNHKAAVDRHETIMTTVDPTADLEFMKSRNNV